MKKMAVLIAAAAAAVGISARPAAAQTVITCESTNGRYVSCPANVSGGASVYRQLSSTTCVQGRNWNVNTRTNVIWVNGGCRAQFMVNSRGGRYNTGGYNNDGYNTYGRYDNGGYNNNRSSTEGLCRRAVRQQVGRRVEVSTWEMNNSRNNARVGWRLENGRSGECRIDRNGNVSVLVNRGR